jgi:hypothetical protein
MWCTSAALAGVLVAFAYHALTRPVPGSPAADLAEADEMAFNNNWIGAAPHCSSYPAILLNRSFARCCIETRDQWSRFGSDIGTHR